MEKKYLTTSVEETKALGCAVSQNLRGGENLFLLGDLGTGKTAFTQGLAEGLGIATPVKSPTFIYLQEYELPMRSTKLAHYDLYRFPGALSAHDLGSLDLPERLSDPDTITVIEWADKLLTLIQESYTIIRFAEDDSNAHAITVPRKLMQVRR